VSGLGEWLGLGVSSAKLTLEKHQDLLRRYERVATLAEGCLPRSAPLSDAQEELRQALLDLRAAQVR
jgi:hypothetical protein